jgi:hypothetical protein
MNEAIPLLLLSTSQACDWVTFYYAVMSRFLFFYLYLIILLSAQFSNTLTLKLYWTLTIRPTQCMWVSRITKFQIQLVRILTSVTYVLRTPGYPATLFAWVPKMLPKTPSCLRERLLSVTVIAALSFVIKPNHYYLAGCTTFPHLSAPTEHL